MFGSYSLARLFSLSRLVSRASATHHFPPPAALIFARYWRAGWGGARAAVWCAGTGRARPRASPLAALAGWQAAPNVVLRVLGTARVLERAHSRRATVVHGVEPPLRKELRFARPPGWRISTSPLRLAHAARSSACCVTIGAGDARYGVTCGPMCVSEAHASSQKAPAMRGNGLRQSHHRSPPRRLASSDNAGLRLRCATPGGAMHVHVHARLLLGGSAEA